MARVVSYRFTADDAHLRSGLGVRRGNAIHIDATDIGVVLYGPYIDLPPGTYRACLRFGGGTPCRGNAAMDVCAGFGTQMLGRASISGDQIARDGMIARLDFFCAEPVAKIEVRLGSEGGFAAEIEELEITGSLASAIPGVELWDLPAVPIENTVSRGRNLYDGYQRGVGLQFYDLAQKILQDPDFKEARELAGDLTILGLLDLCNLFLIIKFYLPRLAPGHIVEFGSYKGGGAIFMAVLARKFLPGCKVFGFDTFAGMPETDRRVDHHQLGSFSDTNLPALLRYVDGTDLRNVEFVQGYFSNTAEATLRQIGSVSLCHIDCDIRSAIECAYDTTKRHMVSGGYWVLNDPMVADCLGATEAMEDFLIRRDGLNSEQVYPHFVFRQP